MKNSYKKLLIAISIATIFGCGGGSVAINVDLSNEETNSEFVQVTKFQDVVLENNISRVNVAEMDHDYHPSSELTFTFYSDGYFKENPTGHAALLMRSNIDIIATRLEGVGLVFGNVSLATNTMPGNPSTLPNPLAPSVQIETWFNGRDTDNFLLAPKNTPPILEDYVNYNVVIKSYITEDKSIQTEQILISRDGNLIWDSGVVVDPNKYIVSTSNDIAVGHVFNNLNANPWKIIFSNISLKYN